MKVLLNAEQISSLRFPRDCADGACWWGATRSSICTGSASIVSICQLQKISWQGCFAARCRWAALKAHFHFYWDKRQLGMHLRLPPVLALDAVRLLCGGRSAIYIYLKNTFLNWRLTDIMRPNCFQVTFGFAWDTGQISSLSQRMSLIIQTTFKQRNPEHEFQSLKNQTHAHTALLLSCCSGLMHCHVISESLKKAWKQKSSLMTENVIK